MKLTHHDLVFEDLKEEWWVEAGMVGFVASGSSYRVDSNAFPGRKVYEVLIEDIGPVHRKLSAGSFNDDKETGKSAKERVICILRGFLKDVAIPPVEVVKLPPDSPYRYKLTHGCASPLLFTGSSLYPRSSGLAVLIGKLLISDSPSRIPSLSQPWPSVASPCKFREIV